MIKNLVALFMASVLLFSCRKEDEKENVVNAGNPDTGYLYGTFVINEGAFLNNNASVSYINSSGEITNDLYLQVNGSELGDILQSFVIIGERGYAVLNNSQKVEVIDMKTMQYQSTITGFDYPRYMLDLGNGFAYLTNGSMAGEVKVLDLSTNAVISSISVGNGPEKMLRQGNYVFVCNSGGWDLDHTISVIDASTNLLVATIEVGDRPTDLVADSNGDIWVMCSGNDSWMTGGETMSKISRIDSDLLQVESEIAIGVAGVHPKNIASSISGQTIYFENNGVYSFSIGSDIPALTEFISTAVGSLDIDPLNGDVWTATVSDFTNPSVVTQYNAAGEVKATFTTGIGTNAIVFN